MHTQRLQEAVALGVRSHVAQVKDDRRTRRRRINLTPTTKITNNPLHTSQAESHARELAKILSLFKEGVMLLDEVDLILHPLKSELNFPTGEKFDLDVSEQVHLTSD